MLTSTGPGALPAWALMAAGRPWSASSGGWMPRARSRSVSSAAGLGPELGDQRPFPLLVLAGHRLRQGQRGGDGQQLLLGAVVDVALDPPPLVVGSGDDPQPRGLQFGQPGAELPVPTSVLRIFQVIGADQLIPIYPTLEEAQGPV